MGEWVPPGYLAWAEVVETVGQALFPKEQTPDGSPPEDVTRWLRDSLAEEKLVAVVQHTDGELEKLPVEFWWRSDPAPRSVLATGTLKLPGPSGAAVPWDRPVLVRESDLEKLLRHRMTVTHEERCRAWLQDEVMKGPKQKSKQEYFKEAKKQGFNISERQFLRIWDDVVPPEWKTPGRPAKRPGNRRTKSPH